jgi:hypothetical protein
MATTEVAPPTAPPAVTATERVPHPSVAERRETGRQARARVPRKGLGRLDLPADRDPIAILARQEERRVDELVPLRRERMAASPFAFFRGAAAVFAADLAASPHTGIEVQLCGDAHLANFGGFASPERSLVFDLNDFDETLPGPFEWDLKRLCASFEVAARANGFDADERSRIQRTLSKRYATAIARFASMDNLDVWYLHLDIDELLAEHGSAIDGELRRRLDRNMTKARSKDRMKALRRLTVGSGDDLRFDSDPPVLVPVADLAADLDPEVLRSTLHEAFRSYRSSLQPDRRRLLGRYRLVDVARKVVGVGSVGTRCWVALLVGRDEDDPLFLQVKEAEHSVLEPYLSTSTYDHQGRRVVEGQRLLQSASDVLLGWERVTGPDGVTRDHYFRQLWDWKASPDIDGMDPELLGLYAEMCAGVLAHAHARSGDACAIAGYVGGGKSLGQAMAAFADAYADLNERDHTEAVARWAPEPVAG